MWRKQKALNIEKHPHLHGHWKIRDYVELESGKWSTRIRARNTFGWSKFSHIQYVVIPDENQGLLIHNLIRTNYVYMFYFKEISIAVFNWQYFCYYFFITK